MRFIPAFLRDIDFFLFLFFALSPQGTSKPWGNIDPNRPKGARLQYNPDFLQDNQGSGKRWLIDCLHEKHLFELRCRHNDSLFRGANNLFHLR